MLEITPSKMDLATLVAKANSGELCIPNFQRDFVWSRDEIADLLRSILRGYFIGSLLLLHSDPNHPPFAPVALRGSAASSDPPRPNMLVLDGQQRLTSLVYALTAPDLELKNSKTPRRYFVNLDLLAKDPDHDGIVFDRTAREVTRDGLDTVAGQWRARSLPCTILLSGSGFMHWNNELAQELLKTSPAEHADFIENYQRQWTEAITGFLRFEVPIVTLPQIARGDKDAIARVCAIFEKLNSTGVELSVYDLLTARLYPAGIDLHALWDQTVAKHRRIAEWSDGLVDNHRFGVLMLRTIALMRGEEIRTKVLINLEPEGFEQHWNSAAIAIERALEIATNMSGDGFGVFHKKWFPSISTLPVLAALRAVIERDKLGSAARKDLKRWYWCSVFLQRYSGSIETRSRRDYLDFTRRWSGEEVQPAVFADAKARLGSPEYSIFEAASAASSAYAGVFCLLAQNGANDWGADESIELQTLEDHHIFPQNYLRGRGFDPTKDKTQINTILNRTLISDATNRKITDHAPAKYISLPSVFRGDVSQLLGPHFIGPAALDALARATTELNGDSLRSVYDEFTRSREAEILAVIRRVCGIKVSDDSSVNVGDQEE